MEMESSIRLDDDRSDYWDLKRVDLIFVCLFVLIFGKRKCCFEIGVKKLGCMRYTKETQVYN